MNTWSSPPYRLSALTPKTVWRSFPRVLFFALTLGIFFSFFLIVAPHFALATISPQIIIDETLVVYDIPRGYTNAPQSMVKAIKEEYGVMAPASWVDFVAAYTPIIADSLRDPALRPDSGMSPDSTLHPGNTLPDANRLGPSAPTPQKERSIQATERLVIFLEMEFIPLTFSAKDFRKLNAPVIQFLRSDYFPAREFIMENCRVALSRPQVLRNTDKQFTISFLETFTCPKGTTWTQTTTSRFRVHNKIITVHQLCTSADYSDILTFKKNYAKALTNLRFR